MENETDIILRGILVALERAGVLERHTIGEVCSTIEQDGGFEQSGRLQLFTARLRQACRLD